MIEIVGSHLHLFMLLAGALICFLISRNET